MRARRQQVVRATQSVLFIIDYLRMRSSKMTVKTGLAKTGPAGLLATAMPIFHYVLTCVCVEMNIDVPAGVGAPLLDTTILHEVRCVPYSYFRTLYKSAH